MAVAEEIDKYEEDLEKLIDTGKEKGYLTYGEVNDLLPASDQQEFCFDTAVLEWPRYCHDVYLPAVVGGYAKSVAGCVVVGCDDGPQVGGAPGPSSSGSTEPPPANPGPSDPH